eukprot:9045065-Pyramimonas_sp.AAC.1
MRSLLLISVVVWASQAHASDTLKLASELQVAAIVQWPLPGVNRRVFFSSPLPLPPPACREQLLLLEGRLPPLAGTARTAREAAGLVACPFRMPSHSEMA